jgi:hypothetical protein
MAAGIDVFFTGLMLICLDGQDKTCPVGKYEKNTALIVKANGPRRICGWYSSEENKLELRFKKGDFEGQKPKSTLDCKETKNEKGEYEVICSLPEMDICLVPDQHKTYPNPKLENLPRLDEIDRRLLAPMEKLLENDSYVSARIHFPTGEITTDDWWPTEGSPTRWYRSDGDTDKAFPRGLSDRLKVAYGKANKLTLTDCKGADIIVLTPQRDGADVVLQNISKYPPTPDYDDEGIYESLSYLLWYYRLGSWDTRSGKCPDYTKAKKDAIVLRCVSKEETGCVYDPRAKNDTRFWPPMLGPRPRQ